MVLPGGRTLIINVWHIQRINHDPIESDQDSAPETISDTADWLHLNENLYIVNDSDDDCAVDGEIDIGQDHSIENPECSEQQDGRAMPNVPGSIRPTLKSKRQAEKVLVKVNPIKVRRNKAVKEK